MYSSNENCGAGFFAHSSPQDNRKTSALLSSDPKLRIKQAIARYMQRSKGPNIGRIHPADSQLALTLKRKLCLPLPFPFLHSSLEKQRRVGESLQEVVEKQRGEGIIPAVSSGCQSPLSAGRGTGSNRRCVFDEFLINRADM